MVLVKHKKLVAPLTTFSDNLVNYCNSLRRHWTPIARQVNAKQTSIGIEFADSQKEYSRTSLDCASRNLYPTADDAIITVGQPAGRFEGLQKRHVGHLVAHNRL